VYTYTDGANTESFTGYLPHHRKTDTEWSVNLLDMNTTPSVIDSTTCYVMVYDGTNPSKSWGTDASIYDTNPVEGYINGGDVNPGEYKSVFDVTEHYLLLMAKACDSSGPYYDVGKGAHNGAHGFEPPSNFILVYDSKQDIKYLYITEGTLDVSMGAKS